MEKISENDLIKYFTDFSYKFKIILWIIVYPLVLVIIYYWFALYGAFFRWIEWLASYWTNIQAYLMMFWMLILLGFIYWMLYMVFIDGFVYKKLWNILFKEKSKKILQYTQQINILEQLCNQKIQDLDEIYKVSQTCYSMLCEFMDLKNQGNAQFKIFRFMKEQLAIINTILTDLRYDLQNRINQQKQLLESAKSEALDNIKWTTELEQVSELQRIRLDKQIKQFEELQKILIKT